MPLIHINADLSRATKLLERIAQALEVIVLEQYGRRLGHCLDPVPDPDPSNQPTVEYSTDDDLARDKLEDLIGLAKQREDSDVTQDRDRI